MINNYLFNVEIQEYEADYQTELDIILSWDCSGEEQITIHQTTTN